MPSERVHAWAGGRDSLVGSFGFLLRPIHADLMSCIAESIRGRAYRTGVTPWYVPCHTCPMLRSAAGDRCAGRTPGRHPGAMMSGWEEPRTRSIGSADDSSSRTRTGGLHD